MRCQRGVRRDFWPFLLDRASICSPFPLQKNACVYDYWFIEPVTPASHSIYSGYNSGDEGSTCFGSRGRRFKSWHSDHLVDRIGSDLALRGPRKLAAESVNNLPEP